MKCPFCNFDLEIIPLTNILKGFPPYFCAHCDMQFFEEELGYCKSCGIQFNKKALEQHKRRKENETNLS